ncbi:hypothetical protein E2C01_063441 [Portunus trituberculatus]|uniref:Uncharacterized protein n=1 Tax=Portunus trituberculatus TaxID=210409 RepID=A0A5B7HI58_PORTR|nr:hypothetical protein [Portunus trituberculatus]
MDRIRTRALGDPSDPEARMVPLYHGGPNELSYSLFTISNGSFTLMGFISCATVLMRLYLWHWLQVAVWKKYLKFLVTNED